MLHEGIARVRRQALAALVPPARLKLSDWIEASVNLPSEVSALPGKVRLWPFQREIADAIGDRRNERVTLVKPVRVGFTTLLTSALASFVVNDPAPILALLPTESDARDFVVSDLEPVFDASPALVGMIGAERDERGRNTLNSRRFPGGSLKVVAAKSQRNLRRHTVRVLLCDEVDAMESGAEGDPLVLAERRTLSYADRKIVIGSTPILAESSKVLASYAASDQRVFEVPCPSCGAFNEIRWQHIVWKPGAPETAAYQCPHCEELIDERSKAAMVAAGRWRATAPHVKGHAGFRLNALVSLLANASWGKLAAEYLAAKDDPEKLQVFTNTLLAEGWSDGVGEGFDEEELAAGAREFGLNAIPADVLFITAGCDVQRDRIEVTLLGFDREGALYVLAHEIVDGGPDEATTWAELDELLKTKWDHPHGGKIGIDAAVVDAGDGGVMDQVIAFCAPRSSRRIMAGKGMAGDRRFIERTQAKKSGRVLYRVGSDSIKKHLDRQRRRGAILFSSTLEPWWYEQFASERLVTRHVRGRPQKRWERIPGRRAEALDCTVYAVAARQVLHTSPDAREADLRNPTMTKPKPAPVIRSAYFDRNRKF